MTCSCTGHRPQSFPFQYGGNGKEYAIYLKKLKSCTETVIEKYGIDRFISGMALGVDLDFAEIVLELRNTRPITLECAVPCPDQTLKWSAQDKARYERILKKADKVTFVSEYYYAGCMLKRNRYMVDHSELVIAVFNGIEKGGTWYTICYAREKGVPLLTVDLNEI